MKINVRHPNSLLSPRSCGIASHVPDSDSTAKSHAWTADSNYTVARCGVTTDIPAYDDDTQPPLLEACPTCLALWIKDCGS
jgi:hypothetical protein